ncbi:hypothetical protein CBR_g8518 [Chara braunii]|uniref:Uncharacterized protein n=1 Tax=Chara braunii TaxID=69332 RepID=A0A388KMF4_CHABU|nr:hypothetical protein CBR_g8518 [Chara braunii]|eukprot:GBG71215.1 hypothetical protein CBR_g8518 [Chara braunii]
MFSNSPELMALGVQHMSLSGLGFFYRREDNLQGNEAIYKPDHAGADSTPKFYIINGTIANARNGSLVPAQFSCYVANLTDGTCSSEMVKVEDSYPARLNDYRTRFYVREAAAFPNTSQFEILVGSFCEFPLLLP